MKNPYLAKLVLPLLCAGAGISSAHAQSASTVSGRVLDEKGEGLPGVTVIIDGTTLGGSTNGDGTFLIQNAPAGPQTLIISFVGFSTQRKSITVTAGQNTAVAALSLSENTTLLNEAVVIGYGTQRKQDVTGAVAAISAKDFVKGQITNPEQLIQGKIAGVSITTGGGAPGAANQVRIRGNSSLNANNDPLYVIDGVPVDKGGISGASNPLSLINPDDIQTITVLKDASATAIYGNRASNGVILVTTKSGLPGERLTVNVSSQTSFSQRFKEFDVLNADELRAIVRENGSASQLATLGTANTNWQDQIFRTATTFDNTVSLTGAVGKLPFRVSYGNLSQEGIVITNKLNRNSASISLTPVLFNDRLRVTINAKGARVDNRFIDNGQVGAAVLYDPTKPVLTDEARFGRYGGYSQFLQPDGLPLSLAPGNPVASLRNTNNISTVDRLIGNVQLDYKLPFVEGLRANLNLGTDVSKGDGSTAINLADLGNFQTQGRFTQFNQRKNMQLLETYLAYGRNFGDTRFDIQGGYSYQKFIEKGDRFLDRRFDRTTLINSADVLSVSGYYNPLYLISYFGRSTVNVKDRYLLTATVRYDQTSRFAKNNNSGWFPAVGLGWRIKGEEFLADNSTISELKLRGGYGRTGQQDIGGVFDYLPRYIIGNGAAQYLFDGKPVITSRASGYNDQLRWETTTTINAGLDYGFFDNRISGAIDAYERKSTDLFSLVNVPAGGNLTNQLNANIGSLRNRGLEFLINGSVIRSQDLNLDLNFNLAYNQNEITELGPQQENFAGFPIGGIPGGTGSNIQINTVGFPSNSFYVQQQVYDANGRPIQGVFVDRDGNGTVTPNVSDFYRYKQPAPLLTLGFSPSISYRDLNFSFLLRSNVGNYVYNANASNLANFANAKGSTGFVTNLPRDIYSTGFTSQQLFSDYYLQNASFLRCENIVLGYNLGKLAGEKTNIRFNAAVQNAFLVTKYKGIDPEIAGGIDNNFYPRARTLTLGFNIGF